ncbi:hypothetical protein V8F06_000481 [Rhypophila decipiens]
MQFKAILTLLATTQLVASLAVDNISLNPINLEASELQRRPRRHQIGAIDPGRCKDTCYWSSDPIGSLKAVGDATYGTNCQLYYDYNCQQQVGETGNTATGGGRCYTPPDGRTGHSFRCWYRC